MSSHPSGKLGDDDVDDDDLDGGEVDDARDDDMSCGSCREKARCQYTVTFSILSCHSDEQGIAFCVCLCVRLRRHFSFTNTALTLFLSWHTLALVSRSTLVCDRTRASTEIEKNIERRTENVFPINQIKL